MNMENTHFDKLVTSLKEGITVFYFKKVDGSLRMAIGTNNSAIIGQEIEKIKAKALIENLSSWDVNDSAQQIISDFHKIPETTPKEVKENQEILRYYDIVSQGFRSARKDSIIYLKEVLTDLQNNKPSEITDWFVNSI